MNVLEVPIQAVQRPSPYGSSSSLISDLFTLDPKAKYLTPQPSVRHAPLMSSHTNLQRLSATPISVKVPESTSQAPGGENQPIYHSFSSSTSKSQKSRSSSSPTKRLFSAAFCKMRATRSANLATPESRGDQHSSSIVKVKFPGDGGSGLALKDSKVATNFPNANPAQTSLKIIHHPTADMKCVLPPPGHIFSHECLSPLSLGPAEDQVTPKVLRRDNLKSSSYSTSFRQLREQNLPSEEPSSRRRSTLSATFESTRGLNSRKTDASRIQPAQGAKDDGFHCVDRYYGRQSYSDSVSSYATSHLFSPGLASSSGSTDEFYPYHLSPPGTPSINELGVKLLEAGLLCHAETHIASSDVHGPESFRNSPAANLHHATCTGLEGFQRYCFAETERASAIALRKTPNATPNSRCVSSPFGKKSGRDLVTSWKDGPEHRFTGPGDFLDDLRYLGEIIV